MYRNEEPFHAGKGNESPSREIDRQIAVLRVQQEHEKLRRRTIEEAQSKIAGQKRREIEERAGKEKVRASNVDAKARECLKKIERLEALHQRQQDAVRDSEPRIARLENNARQLKAAFENNCIELTHTKELLEGVDGHSLRSSLEDAQKYLITQTDRLTRQTRLFEDANNKKKKLKDELASIEAEIAEVEKNITLEEEQMGGMQQEMAEADAEIEQLNADIAKCEEENSDLTDQLSSMNAHLMKKSAAVAAMEEQATAKETELAALKQQLQEIEVEKVSVKKETDDARVELETERATCSDMKDELANVRLETEKVNAQLNALHKDLEAQALRRTSIEQQRQLATVAEQTAQAYIAHLETELAREKNALGELMAAIQKTTEEPDAATTAAKGQAVAPSSDESSVESIEDESYMEVHSAP